MIQSIAAFRNFVLALHGVPTIPISESLAIIELSSHSSAERASDSDIWELDDRVGKKGKGQTYRKLLLRGSQLPYLQSLSKPLGLKLIRDIINYMLFLVTYLVPR